MGSDINLFLWFILIAAVPVAAAGLILRRNPAGQSVSVRRGIIGWALIALALLMAASAAFFFWTA